MGEEGKGEGRGRRYKWAGCQPTGEVPDPNWGPSIWDTSVSKIAKNCGKTRKIKNDTIGMDVKEGQKRAPPFPTRNPSALGWGLIQPPGLA